MKKAASEDRIHKAMAVYDSDPRIAASFEESYNGYIAFCRCHAGVSGMAKIARSIEKAQEATANQPLPVVTAKPEAPVAETLPLYARSDFPF